MSCECCLSRVPQKSVLYIATTPPLPNCSVEGIPLSNSLPRLPSSKFSYGKFCMLEKFNSSGAIDNVHLSVPFFCTVDLHLSESRSTETPSQPS